ncbi:carbohydrate ABC transporter substrate-binding protein (CUT1 family) [Anaerobacterium chartisolvens]|uniref:Carbohydrate ABC transporter substrate-binding protein (CUT1 family) n=1 Tax=Anaerobacterium chartisolvens TaxID=1297424 RepID=A0A369AJZ7_9FIRM|nr:sugar ABC transporter substrate-binding protein [Anaerobacterium chartisolvens]RCX08668.1 carbohydrate ABC transporter substrate-binding protein (CUT1 family) [Anaerobacterium chartisolvens]
MKKVKSLLSSFLAVALIMALLAGCGAGGSNTADNTAGKAATGNGTEQSGGTAAQAGEQPYKGQAISCVGFGAKWTDVMVKGLEEFKANTGITVNFQQLANDQIANKVAVSSAAGGKDLDVIAFAPLQNTLLYTKNGWLEPLDEYVSKSQDFDIKDFFETGLEISTRDGKLYGIPVMTEREIVYYNKEMFAKANVKIPKTFDELTEAAKKLNDPANGICGIAIRGKGPAAVTQFSGFLRGFGGDFINDGKAVINTPEAIKAFQYYGDLLRNYGPKGVGNMDWTDTQSLFTQGRAAMRIDADSQYGFAVDKKSSLIYDKVGYFALPAGPAGAKPYNITAWDLGISSGSQHKEASWEFIKWIMGKDMDVKTELAGNPSARASTWSNKDASKNFPSELVDVINQTTPVSVGTDRPYMINVGEARTQIGTVIIAAIEGKDVKAAADKANAAVQELLDKEK